MPGSFLDSNALLYFASRDPIKGERAERLISAGGFISVQVLNEVAAVSRRKFGLTWAEIDVVLAVIRRALRVEPLSLRTHDLGLVIARRHKLRIYDSMLLAAALLADCDTLWSEDMQDGFVLAGMLTIRNPFRL